MVRPPGAADGVAPSGVGADPGAETNTRSEVVTLLLEAGPVSAAEIGERLGLSAAGARRHIDALVDSGEATVASSAGRRRNGPGRPAKLFRLTEVGRARLGHSYDDLAGAAIRQLREIGGQDAVTELARRRVRAIVDGAGQTDEAADEDSRLTRVAQNIAAAMTEAGYVADTRRVGNGVQICRHHCPVADMAAEFPELCEAEQEAFRDLLGTHIQQLATIANGDSVCTTHVPLGLPSRAEPAKPGARKHSGRDTSGPD